jgi:hypothetical protein
MRAIVEACWPRADVLESITMEGERLIGQGLLQSVLHRAA